MILQFLAEEVKVPITNCCTCDPAHNREILCSSFGRYLNQSEIFYESIIDRYILKDQW